MALVQTKAIVLSAIKYSDTSLIVRCFTLKEGVKSYLLKGVLSARKSKLKPAYFQPLNQLYIEANHNTKGALNSIREVHIAHPFQSIHAQIFKQTIVLFLAEMLGKTIREEEENEPLFDYLESSIIWLDTHDEVSNFHLFFLFNLTRYLGFFPDLSENHREGFHLLDGVFTDEILDKEVLTGESLKQFKKLFHVTTENYHTVSFHKTERQQVLQLLIRYFELQLDGFQKPKSLAVLETVFS
ncbi:DNA repair protein RecO [Polaribacter pacificus]|uniref:DNA repair protein RecO n=1 Tax=Polaribacter pacificus TaxID=1775173 RepID=A0A917HWW2_9FLAO|nr:DNA repair protein RecO [Polaribacter pacificus]GGG93462.1 DNA repair protein RecO [Polaribacter pacificus]